MRTSRSSATNSCGTPCVRAVQANVSLYAIDPRGMLNRGWISPSVDGRGGPDAARRRMLMVEAAKPNVLDGFYVLSDHTGGFAVTDTNNYRDPFDRIVTGEQHVRLARLHVDEQQN